MFDLIIIGLLLLLLIIRIIKTKTFTTSVLFLVVLSYIVIYLVPTLNYQDLSIDRQSLMKFYLLFLVALFSLIMGFTWKNKLLNSNLQRIKRNQNQSYWIYFITAIILKIAIINFSSYSENNIVKGLVFIMDDISTIFFFGFIYAFFMNGKKTNYIIKSLIIVIFYGLFYMADVINSLKGEEYSRYNLLLAIIIIFVFLLENVKRKLRFSTIAIASCVVIILSFQILNRGDMLILKHGTDTINALQFNVTNYKPFLILYNLGFYMIAIPLGIKPLYYTANGQYMLDILGYSSYQVASYPFGIGITGVVDSYWNWGILGVIFFFYCAGFYLKILRNNAIKYNSSFLYGIYILQVCKLFLLFRLDFSFFFGRLIVILPVLYYITRRFANENKHNKFE
ncbi:hypothetical protein [Paenibacillus prosopidis]|uniref:Oligosaccharide repeat unit polymerase n=1 Tax=Paenibacillus prosopidis TaxID=630520 RepID=A0A368W1T7_9BACL|nr:hypothetical protein [Paenibacillus prosopidis]RCW47882.1 hypothetical protein DFP97_10782 [Paenibacillus prosopidis]